MMLAGILRGCEGLKVGGRCVKYLRSHCISEVGRFLQFIPVLLQQPTDLEPSTEISIWMLYCTLA